MRSFVRGPGDFESCLLVISNVPSIGSGLFLILLSLGPVTYDHLLALLCLRYTVGLGLLHVIASYEITYSLTEPGYL